MMVLKRDSRGADRAFQRKLDRLFSMAKNSFTEANPVHGGQSASSLRQDNEAIVQHLPHEEVLGLAR